MKIVKLMGGLGNQMFEWAFGYALSKNTVDEVLYDLSWFNEISKIKESYLGDGVAKRVYELDCFNIDIQFSTKEQNKSCLSEQQIRNSYLPHFLRKIFKIDKYKIISNKVFEKECNIYEPELLNLGGDNYFEGYFQCEKYFKQYREDILKAFSLKYDLDEQNKRMLNKITSCNSVSLHVRRGDYINLQEVHGLCSREYYQKAIDYIANKIDNPHFFLFSDDIDWVKENLKIDYEYTIVDINSSNEGYFDLELMKNCKHNIIANSSFSWWGAWLNNNPQKIVIAPTKWFADKKYKYDDIICNDWIRM